MPKTMKEAVNEGCRRFVTNLLAELGGSVGRNLIWVIGGIILFAVGASFLGSAMDWFTNPFVTAWDWTTDLFTFGDSATEPETTEVVAVTEEPENESEHGLICRYSHSFNPLCN